jgi:Mg2+/citrate symporter
MSLIASERLSFLISIIVVPSEFLIFGLVTRGDLFEEVQLFLNALQQFLDLPFLLRVGLFHFTTLIYRLD